MEQIAPIAALLRGYIEQASPQAAAAVSTAPDIALVGGAGAIALVLVFMLFGMIGALFKPKKERAPKEAKAPPARAVAKEPPSRPAPQRTPDPVQKIQRDTETGVARAKQDSERLAALLTGERDKAVAAGVKFATEPPMRSFVLLAETLIASEAPALSAARRKIASGDFDGARADLRRQAQENGGREGAWRNLAVLECLRDLPSAMEALEKARVADPRDFVTLVMLRRLYSGTGQPQQAYDAAKSAVAAAQGEREQAVALDELGIVCLQLEDGVGARKALSESLALVKKLAAAAPNDLERLRDVAVGHYKLATLQGPDAKEQLMLSVDAFERLKKRHPLEAGDEQALGQLKNVLEDMRKAEAPKA